MESKRNFLGHFGSYIEEKMKCGMTIFFNFWHHHAISLIILNLHRSSTQKCIVQNNSELFVSVLEHFAV